MVVPVEGSRQQGALHFTLPFPAHPQSRANTAGKPQGPRPPAAEGSEKGRGRGGELRSLSPLSLYPVSALQTFSFSLWYPTPS